jgi:hypothetical protein
MRVYITESQVPELRALTPDLRRLALQRAFALMRLHHRLFYWLSTLFCVIGGVMGTFVGLAFVGHLHLPLGIEGDDWLLQNMVWSYSGIGVGSFSAGFIGLQLQRWKLRPYLRLATEAYGFETKQAT